MTTFDTNMNNRFEITPEMNVLNRMGTTFQKFWSDWLSRKYITDFKMTDVLDCTMGGVAGAASIAMLMSSVPDPSMSQLIGIPIAAIVAGSLTSTLARSVAYSAFTELGHQANNAMAFTFGTLKKGFQGFVSLFKSEKDKMDPALANEIENDINYLEKALDEFKDDYVMVAALGQLDVLTPQEYKAIRNNYDHIVEASESKLLDKNSLTTVFREMSYGKVATIIANNEAIFTNEPLVGLLREKTTLDNKVDEPQLPQPTF